MATFKITRITNPINYWDEFCQNVKEIDKLDDLAIEAVQINSSNILDLLNDTKSVLVFGQVQSGKTLNYSGLIARTLESKYDLVLILAGTKTNLVDQTYERLKSYFSSSPDIDILKMNNEINIRQQLNRIHENRGRKLILVSLKHQDYLQKIGLELHLNAVSTLVLDDEADQASLSPQ
jgi:superfamily II DNA or RNA helicase